MSSDALGELMAGAPDVPKEHIRLLTKVARMYHELGMRQPQIATQLHVSQARVSRLLRQAVALGIVRTVVVAPRTVHSELEEQIERRYGLSEVVVADTEGLSDEAAVQQALGSAAATYLETTLTGGDRIGVSSWSSTLLATVDAMRPRPTRVADQVVQVLGGVGDSAAQSRASRLLSRFAQITRAEALFLMAPGLLGNAEMRRVMITEPNIASVLQTYGELTMALVGVGSLEPSPLLRESGNAIDERDQERLRELGAVGDICMRFFDAEGRHLASDLDERVLGIDAATLVSIPRRVGVAGGERKWGAIRAALSGGWLNVLITDLHTAQRLASGRDVGSTTKGEEEL
jgi:DNA-binding transcriptional regulator LsrR (DeoR family)